jgi:hypothetical protein
MPDGGKILGCIAGCDVNFGAIGCGCICDGVGWGTRSGNGNAVGVEFGTIAGTRLGSTFGAIGCWTLGCATGEIVDSGGTETVVG